MIPIAFAAFFGYAWGMLAVRILTRRRISNRAFQASFTYLCVVTAIAVANFEFGVLEQKGASEIALRVFEGSSGEPSTFVLQALVNAVPFALTGAWYAAIGTNVAIVAVALAYLHERDRRIARIMWAPAVVNFALFALRDPLIGVCFMALTVMLCVPPARLRSKLAEWAVVLFTYLARPETVAVYVGGKASQVWQRVGRRTWMLVLLPVVALALLAGLSYLPRTLGLQTQASLNELPGVLSQFFESRAGRSSVGIGSGSNILGGALPGLPFVVRFPIQVLSFFVLPFPFEITTVFLLLAFVDSVVFITLTVRFFRRAPATAKRVFVLYAGAVSFFASNYGNVLRLRMPAYFIIAGGLLAARLLPATRKVAKPAQPPAVLTGSVPLRPAP